MKKIPSRSWSKKQWTNTGKCWKSELHDSLCSVLHSRSSLQNRKIFLKGVELSSTADKTEKNKQVNQRQFQFSWCIALSRVLVFFRWSFEAIYRLMHNIRIPARSSFANYYVESIEPKRYFRLFFSPPLSLLPQSCAVHLVASLSYRADYYKRQGLYRDYIRNEIFSPFTLLPPPSLVVFAVRFDLGL